MPKDINTKQWLKLYARRSDVLHMAAMEGRLEIVKWLLS